VKEAYDNAWKISYERVGSQWSTLEKLITKDLQDLDRQFNDSNVSGRFATLSEDELRPIFMTIINLVDLAARTHEAFDKCVIGINTLNGILQNDPVRRLNLAVQDPLLDDLTALQVAKNRWNFLVGTAYLQIESLGASLTTEQKQRLEEAITKKTVQLTITERVWSQVKRAGTWIIQTIKSLLYGAIRKALDHKWFLAFGISFVLLVLNPGITGSAFVLSLLSTFNIGLNLAGWLQFARQMCHTFFSTIEGVLLLIMFWPIAWQFIKLAIATNAKLFVGMLSGISLVLGITSGVGAGVGAGIAALGFAAPFIKSFIDYVMVAFGWLIDRMVGSLPSGVLNPNTSRWLATIYAVGGTIFGYIFKAFFLLKFMKPLCEVGANISSIFLNIVRIGKSAVEAAATFTSPAVVVASTAASTAEVANGVIQFFGDVPEIIGRAFTGDYASDAAIKLAEVQQKITDEVEKSSAQLLNDLTERMKSWIGGAETGKLYDLPDAIRFTMIRKIRRMLGDDVESLPQDVEDRLNQVLLLVDPKYYWDMVPNTGLIDFVGKNQPLILALSLMFMGLIVTFVTPSQIQINEPLRKSPTFITNPILQEYFNSLIEKGDVPDKMVLLKILMWNRYEARNAKLQLSPEQVDKLRKANNEKEQTKLLEEFAAKNLQYKQAEILAVEHRLEEEQRHLEQQYMEYLRSRENQREITRTTKAIEDFDKGADGYHPDSSLIDEEYKRLTVDQTRNKSRNDLLNDLLMKTPLTAPYDEKRGKYETARKARTEQQIKTDEVEKQRHRNLIADFALKQEVLATKFLLEPTNLASQELTLLLAELQQTRRGNQGTAVPSVGTQERYELPITRFAAAGEKRPS